MGSSQQTGGVFSEWHDPIELEEIFSLGASSNMLRGWGGGVQVGTRGVKMGI